MRWRRPDVLSGSSGVTGADAVVVSQIEAHSSQNRMFSYFGKFASNRTFGAIGSAGNLNSELKQARAGPL
jgi:hypothetical protein